MGRYVLYSTNATGTAQIILHCITMPSRSSISWVSLLLLALLSINSDIIVAGADNTVSSDEDICACQLLDRPNLKNKEETARWMVHSLDWGVMSTISTRLKGEAPIPFGNPYSFVDGPCDGSTGIPYVYGTYMDQTFKDTVDNAAVSLTLSEASLASVCGGSNLKGCLIGGYGDPENPLCARLVLTGTFLIVPPGDELDTAKEALFARHTSMKQWPVGHEWLVAKLEIQDIWLIDFFGGASILNVDDYLAVDLLGEAEAAN
jgi:hypothetical protein